MNIGLIKKVEGVGRCINVVVMDVEPTQEEKDTLIPDVCDDVVIIPTGFWIGDSYDGVNWYKSGPQPLSIEQKYDLLASENTLLTAKLQAQSDRGDFVEECLAEMATLVYV